mmetsp:Transcript_13403/g.23997  ORF Transcript_13403/g.23997 Transcript_13403/m.23997 type:complete len:645 (-) Transcript_13403:1082-3016(-)
MEVVGRTAHAARSGRMFPPLTRLLGLQANACRSVVDGKFMQKRGFAASTNGDNCKTYAIGNSDSRLLLLEEQKGLISTTNVVVGELLYSPQRQDPVAVIMFQGHGFSFGCRLTDDIITDQILSTRADKQLEISETANAANKLVLNPLDICLQNQQGHPIFRAQPRDVEREVIFEGCQTGIPSVDALTPIGRGQSMLFASKFSKQDAEIRDNFMLDTAIGILKANTNMHAWFSMPPTLSSGSNIFGKQNVQQVLENSGVRNRGTLVQPQLICPEDDADVLGMLSTYVSCTLAETLRDQGGHSLLVLADLHSSYRVWRRSQRLAADFYQQSRGIMPESIFSPGADRADLRQFYSSLIQRSAQMHPDLGRGSMSALQGVFTGNITVSDVVSTSGTQNSDQEDVEYDFKDLVMDTSRSAKELNRLKLLVDKGIKLTPATLQKIGIALPKSTEEKSEVDLKIEWGLTGPINTESTQSQHAEELKSISDGHIVMLPDTAMFDFDFRNSLTRIGIGSNKKRSKDTRKVALRQVAGPLRLQLSTMLDESPEQGNVIPERFKAFSVGLRHQKGEYLTVVEQVVLIYAIAEGLFDTEQQRRFITGSRRAVTIKSVVDAIPPHVVDVIVGNKDVLSEKDLNEIKSAIIAVTGAQV